MTIEEIKIAVTHLSPKELLNFRDWFDEYEAKIWDRKFEEDVNAGRLNQIAEKAIRAYEAGEVTEL
jgi:hypothetical protein